MATTKSTTPRTRTASRTTATRKPRATAAKSASSTKADDSIVARTGRTLKERPYTSAAIATGAVTIAAAVGAAGAFLLSRRDKSFKEASSELSDKVKGGFASASETVMDGLASASGTVKDLGQRGSAMFRGDSANDADRDTRTQQQIAEEALTLKKTGAANSALDDQSASEVKTGAIAY